MTPYLLDTNTISHALRGHPAVLARLTAVPMASLKISVISEAELRFGLARRPDAVRLHKLVEEFLQRVEVLDWDRECAACYSRLRADLSLRGKTVAAMVLLIATHAVVTRAVLVTNDRAFAQCDVLTLEDWTA
ncbi:MAG: type II toxin-antitoxin system VapC family toxin [Xanthomonadales bacterium]|nr:type II toxin-antitoxin system VapC family toxin [Xanthomonadales bacterium]